MTLTPVSFSLWLVAGFLSGSLPFSIWVTRLFVRQDVRGYGDTNPGATNALKAGGWKVGLLALMLDVTKGVLPVALTYQVYGWRGGWMVPLALAPLVGSAFSPFLGFRGGKSLSVSLGIWIGLTLWQAPLAILSALSLAFLLQTSSGWAVMAAILAIAGYLALTGQTATFWAILGLQALLLVWKFRDDISRRPVPRDWLKRRSK